jgi:hypothetical protein
MATATKAEARGRDADDRNLLALKPKEELDRATKSQVQVIGKNVICMTDYRAHKRDPTEIVVDATDGFVPLWQEDLVLYWRFNLASLSVFRQPDAIRTRIRALLNEAILAWGDAAPIRFDENADNSDFEIVVEQFERCTPQGCTLARAFFPDAGRHQLVVYPTMFEQSREEQVETLAHEIGHIFGLRHFFAPEVETPWPSVIFGEHAPFSIMNYGEESELTDRDRADLKLLYESVWSGKLRKINRTPVKLFRPFHYLFG